MDLPVSLLREPSADALADARQELSSPNEREDEGDKADFSARHPEEHQRYLYHADRALREEPKPCRTQVLP
jgi:hypothetical protein